MRVEAYVTRDHDTYSAHNIPLPEAMHSEFGFIAPEVTISLVQSSNTYTKVEVWGSIAWPDDTQAYRAFSVHAPERGYDAMLHLSYSPQAEANIAPVPADENDLTVLSELLANIEAIHQHEVSN